ncbi:MAG: ABC transporter ATP-binding protein [Planctomycetes bacterium]|nr:ABC transporter ATP-binding protein [Planctomycetota bacterium]MCA8935485.1 ABC transporter ATP-binding protein [Planctomycetota bacterium]MCA8946348.1 ABC transporter ATP-binding protein [Planctomycetota bacterium]
MNEPTESEPAQTATETAEAGPSDREVILECHKLSRDFQSGEIKLHVLRSVDFQLYEGEMASIVGSSGAGKSTLLHLLGLLDTPTAGEVIYRGRNLTKLGEEAAAKVRNREFGFVFQSFHLLPDFTALENVLMPARIGAGSMKWMREATKLKQRAADLLDRVGLGARQSHVPSRLSGGERQRVALARALINEPAVVFCDEPTGNLDSKTADEIFGLIEQFNKELGKTFLIVTHDDHIAQRAQRHLHMVDGVFVDRPE